MMLNTKQIASIKREINSHFGCHPDDWVKHYWGYYWDTVEFELKKDVQLWICIDYSLAGDGNEIRYMITDLKDFTLLKDKSYSLDAFKEYTPYYIHFAVVQMLMDIDEFKKGI